MRWTLLGLLLLTGCPKSVTVTCSWTGNGNPNVPACAAAPVPDCMLNYTLLNASTGAVIATIPILDANGQPLLSYVFTASTSGMTGATLAMVINEQTISGVVSSPKALSSVTVQ